MFPALKRIPALNLGGSGWPKKRPTIAGRKAKISELTAGDPQVHYPHGEIKIAFAVSPDGVDRLLLASIVAYTADGQMICREEYEEATGQQVEGPMPPLLGERKAAQKAAREGLQICGQLFWS